MFALSEHINSNFAKQRRIDGRIGSEVFNGILQGSTPSPIRL